jgi:hypothetical protein
LEHMLLPYRIIMDFATGIRITVPGESASLVFKVAKEGKLLSLFCDYMDVFTGFNRRYLEKRCLLTKLYTEHLDIVGEKLNASGIEYYVFKTFKPFAYDMTDLDLLFMNRKDMLLASKMLIEICGFKPIARGTYSIALRKTIGGLDIDLDLQTRIAAGTFEYVEVSNIKNIMREIGYTSRKLSFLKPELELVVITGHTFYKDFSISLANILYFDYLRRTINRSILNTILEHYPYLLKPFKLLDYFVNSLQDTIHIGKYPITSDSMKCLECLLMRKSICEVLRKEQGTFPLPLPIAARNYIETANTLVKNHKYNQLYELLNLPRSRGVGLLFRRIGVLPPEETLRV